MAIAHTSLKISNYTDIDHQLKQREVTNMLRKLLLAATITLALHIFLDVQLLMPAVQSGQYSPIHLP